MRLPGVQRARLDQLVQLAWRLFNESDGFIDRPEDQQSWYNRGYAMGMAQALVDMGYEEFLPELPASPDHEQALRLGAFDWGKAYVHGIERGEADTRGVIAPAPGQPLA